MSLSLTVIVNLYFLPVSYKVSVKTSVPGTGQHGNPKIEAASYTPPPKSTG